MSTDDRINDTAKIAYDAAHQFTNVIDVPWEQATDYAQDIYRAIATAVLARTDREKQEAFDAGFRAAGGTIVRDEKTEVG